MKSFILLLLSLLFQNLVFSQNQYLFTFQPLKIIDTIKNQKIIDKVVSRDQINAKFFLAETYNENKGLFLFEKLTNKWIVYDYNDFVSNYMVSKHKFYGKNHPIVHIIASRSGMGTNVYGWVVLFDLEKRSYLVLETSSYNESYEEGKIKVEKCNSDITINKGLMQVKMKCSAANNENYCDYCLSAGTYEIQNGAFVKLNLKR